MVQKNVVCQSDAEYASIERQLSRCSAEEISAMVAKKMQVLLAPKKRVYDEPSTVVTGPAVGCSDGAAVPLHSKEPFLVTAPAMAKLVDATIMAAMQSDLSCWVGESKFGSFEGMQSASTTTFEPTDAFLWRCSLCGCSLLGVPVYSCTAPARAAMPTGSDEEQETVPAARFHHYCSLCHDALGRNCMARPHSNHVVCPRCGRRVPHTRNLNAEMLAASLQQQRGFAGAR